MTPRKRLHLKWDRKWKQDFQHLHICEFRFTGCLVTWGLTPAHSMKRRFIQTEEQYREMAVACLNCHRILDEKMTHKEMKQAVLDAIRSREM